MRFMVIVKANKDSEAGILPDTKLFEAMGKYNEELVKAGVMLAADGLHPSSKGARVKFSDGETLVTDGPFAETKELIAGFWIWKVGSMQEAIDWLKRAPFGGGAEIEIRQIYDVEDLGPNMTPEIRERDQRLRMHLAKSGTTPLLKTLALAFFLCAFWHAQAQEAKTPYPSMAPLDQYLMADRNTEIALARSAAPDSISRDAKVLVLGQHGYETAVEGKNGFVCVVERSWTSPFDDPEFWNPKLRGPLCLNPEAARSILPLTLKRTELVLSGISKAEIRVGIQAFSAKELPALEPGAMTYMTSSQGYLNDEVGHWRPHLMIYVPRTDASDWGASLPGSPVMLLPQDPTDPASVFLIPLRNWSDGTAAPPMNSD